MNSYDKILVSFKLSWRSSYWTKSFYGLLLGLILPCISFFKVSTKTQLTTRITYKVGSRPTLFFMVMDRVPNAEKHMTDSAKKQGWHKPSSLQTWLKTAGKADRDHSKKVQSIQLSKWNTKKQSHARSKSHQHYAYHSQKLHQSSFQRNEPCRSFYGKYVCLILSSGTWCDENLPKIIRHCKPCCWLGKGIWTYPRLTLDTQANLRNEWANCIFLLFGSLSWKRTSMVISVERRMIGSHCASSKALRHS